MHTKEESIIDNHYPILVTGAAGFIGSKVVEGLLRRGFSNIRCLVRSKHRTERLEAFMDVYRQEANVEILYGNLLSPADCSAATKDVAVIYHLAAGAGEKSVPDAFLNSVVATRNLLAATLQQNCLRRFVNISSFAVYDVRQKRGRVLDESCPLEQQPAVLRDAYEFAKLKQDELVFEYAKEHKLPVVTIRPGYVYGPGKSAISGRVGITTFGPFLHLGGTNLIPFTYVDNCADAIVLAGLKPGIEGEVFNVVDDDLPSSRQFLKLYKRNVRRFRSFYVPHVANYAFCWLWERYSAWSEQQLPPVFNRKRWYTYWKRTSYSNRKLKTLLGWLPEVSMAEGLARYFESCRAGEQNA
jgi:nucleoside-diphosphate-sugar epimerase